MTASTLTPAALLEQAAELIAEHGLHPRGMSESGALGVLAAIHMAGHGSHVPLPGVPEAEHEAVTVLAQWAESYGHACLTDWAEAPGLTDRAAVDGLLAAAVDARRNGGVR